MKQKEKDTADQVQSLQESKDKFLNQFKSLSGFQLKSPSELAKTVD